LPRIESRAGRGRFRLGARALLAHGQTLGAVAQGNPARQASSVRIRARTFLVYHPTDRRARRSPTLADIMEWVGWDRLMFSTDYPHWDFDDPQHVFKFKAADENKALVFRANAKALYGLQ